MRGKHVEKLTCCSFHAINLTMQFPNSLNTEFEFCRIVEAVRDFHENVVFLTQSVHTAVQEGFGDINHTRAHVPLSCEDEQHEE